MSFDRAKIKINNIVKDQEYVYLDSPTNQEYSNEIIRKRKN